MSLPTPLARYERLLVLAAPILIGCGDGSSAAEQVQQAGALWQDKGPRDYVFVYERSCYCPPQEALSARVVVKAGKAVGATYSDGRAAEGRAVTVSDLLAELKSWADKKPDYFMLETDPSFGYPKTVQVDFFEHSVDDEQTLTISCFAAGNSDTACLVRGAAPPTHP